MTDQTDRPFRDEPTEVLRAAHSLARTHAKQAARFNPAQQDGSLPAVVDLFRDELQHRGAVTMTDQTALRKLIAHAIHRYDNHHALSGNDVPSEHHYGEADAVLAVLPAPVDQTAEIARLRTMYDVVSARENELIEERDRLLEAQPVDRTAVRCSSCEHEARYHDADGRCWFTVEQGVPGRDAVCSCQLRRMADETQPAEADDTLHACPGRWGGPDCRCFDTDEAQSAPAAPPA